MPKNLPTSKGYVDVHCHLAASEFDSDRDEVILAAKNAGVAAVIVVAEGPDCFEKILDLQEKYPDFTVTSHIFHVLLTPF